MGVLIRVEPCAHTSQMKVLSALRFTPYEAHVIGETFAADGAISFYLLAAPIGTTATIDLSKIP